MTEPPGDRASREHDDDPPARRGTDGLPYTEWWPPPDAAPPPPPTGPPVPAWNEMPLAPIEVPRRRVAATVVSAVLAVVVLAAATAAAVVLLADDGPSHPDEWDPRVEPIARRVAELRDLSFEHPVHVDFLSSEEYSDQTRIAESEITDDDREGLAQQVAELRALGLVSGEVDLLDAQNQVRDAGTLAFYRPEDERIRIRGEQITPGVEVTLAHELVHVLQDQHFDLTTLARPDDPARAGALRSLAEGDAERIEQEYLEGELSAAEQDAAGEEMGGVSGDEPDAPDDPLEDVPDAIVAFSYAPYALGGPFVAGLAADDGNGGVDQAFRDPPRSDEHVLDVLTYLAEDDPIPVELDADGEPYDEGVFGAFSWFAVLSTRVDPAQALEAADGWGGDAYAYTERDGDICAHLRFRGDTVADTGQMAAALDAWAADMPNDPDVRRRSDREVDVVACDPGADVDIEPPRSPMDALALPTVRAFLVADALAAVTPDEARCYAAQVLDGVSVAVLNDPSDEFLEEELPRRAADAIAVCRR